jgi:hypothetical protein
MPKINYLNGFLTHATTYIPTYLNVPKRITVNWSE